MLIKDWMTKNVVTVNVNDSLQHAIDTMIDNQVSILPVLEEGRLVGILTDRDVKRASPSSATLLDIQQALYQLSRLEVGAVMSPHPITVPPDFTLEETAAVLLEKRISGAPVVSNEGHLVGIITKSDVFKALLSLSGSTNKGYMMGFIIDDRPGSIKEVTDIIRGYGARLVSILTSYDKAPQGCRYLYVRLFNVAKDSLEEMKILLRSKFKVLYFIDQIENKRELYSV